MRESAGSITLSITLPIPPIELRPNGRPHWAAKAKRVREYRKAAAWAMRAAIAELPLSDFIRLPLKAVDVCPVYFHKTARRWDADNCIASLKAAIDGLQDAGLIVNDSGVSWRAPVQMKDKANPRVELFVFERRD